MTNSLIMEVIDVLTRTVYLIFGAVIMSQLLCLGIGRTILPGEVVPLDYCGGKTHWHEEGIPTGIDLEQLQKILSDDKQD